MQNIREAFTGRRNAKTKSKEQKWNNIGGKRTVSQPHDDGLVTTGGTLGKGRRPIVWLFVDPGLIRQWEWAVDEVPRRWSFQCSNTGWFWALCVSTKRTKMLNFATWCKNCSLLIWTTAHRSITTDRWLSANSLIKDFEHDPQNLVFLFVVSDRSSINYWYYV